MKTKRLLSLLSFFLLLGSYSVAYLIISEVFIDGTDEFVELYNDGADFQWTLSLEGLKSSTLTLSNISIPSQGYYLLWDNATMFQWISLQKSWLSLNLLDTNAVNIELKDIWWSILDVFVLNQTTVTQYDNTKTAFQKKSLDWVWSIGPVLSSEIHNAAAGFTINPSFVSTTQSSPVSTWSQHTWDATTWSNTPWNNTNNTGQNSWSTTRADIQTGNTQWTWTVWYTGNNENSSWNNWFWDNNIWNTGNIQTTGNTQTGWTTTEILGDIVTPPQSPIFSVRFEEIHPGNDEFFQEYLELWFETAYSGSLRIVWAGHAWAEKIISVSQSVKSRLLVWWEDFWFGNYVVDGLSVSDGGEILTLVWQDGQVLDSIVYNWLVTKKSLYRWGVWDGWRYVFDQVDSMTPGYSKQQIQHLLPSSSGFQLPCGISFQNRIPWYAGTSMNVWWLWNKELISNSNNQFTCSWKLENWIVISNQCNPWYILLAGAILDNLIFEVLYAGDRCVQRIPLNIPDKLVASSSSSSAAGSNYYEEYHLWKEKFYDLLRTVRLLGFDLSTSKLLSLDERILSASLQLTGDTLWFSGVVLFDAILPNPKGKDSAESLRLIMQGTWIVSWLYLQSDKLLFPLSSLDIWDEIAIITTGFWLPNNGTCLDLKYGSQLLDTLCYPKAKEGVRYTHQWEQDGEWVLLSWTKLETLHLKQTSQEICAYLDGKKILCEPLDRTKKDQKSLESTIKKLESSLKKKEKELTKVEKNLEKTELKLVTLTEKQKEIKNTLKEVRVKYTERRKKKEASLTSVRTKNSNLTELTRLSNKYISFLEDVMYHERSWITQDSFSDFLQTRSMYGIIEKSLKQGSKKEFVISPRIYGKSEELLALAQGDISEEMLQVIYPPLYQDLMKDWEQIQKNMMQEDKRVEMVKFGKS